MSLSFYDRLETDRLVIYNNTCYRSGIMRNTEKTISFRAVAEKIDTLDALAAAQDRSRSYLINEAITNYIELHAYQDALVRKGTGRDAERPRRKPRGGRKAAQEDGARSPMIEWTEQATRQLDQAHDYIALSNSEEVAARITMQIVDQRSTARDISHVGQIRPGSRYS